MRDSRTGEPLSFVTVYLSDQSAGTVSDRAGYYVLSVPEGERTVEYSMVGYRTVEQRFSLKRDEAARFDVRLENEPIPVRGVTVSAARERFKREVDVGVRRLEVRDLKLAPSMVEPDLFRSLAALPGVLTVSDFSSALYVRGGSPDQNLVLLDGVTVYNPYHLGGLFSTFNLDALSNAELHAGAFPARYGGAVSSVLDVEMKQGNSERYSGKWDVGLLTTKLMFEGPLPKGSFLVAGRRTYIDAVTWTIGRLASHPEIHLPYYFYDLQAKANFDLSEKDRLTLSGFTGDDVIYLNDSFSKVDFRWGNYTLAGKWRHIFSPEILSTTVMTYARSRVGLAAVDHWSADTSTSALTLRVGDLGLKEDVILFVDSGQTVRFGAEAKRLDLRNHVSADSQVFWDMSERPWYAALYAEDKWQPWRRLLVNAGVRGEYFSNGNYFRASPRASAKYFLREDLAATAGFGLYYQYLSIPFPRDEMTVKMPASFFQQWIPASKDYPPVSAIHYTLGAEKWLSDDARLSLDGYYKQMAHLLETGSGLPDIFSGDSASDTVKFNSGTGWATGAELLLKWKGSWVGYGLGVTKRTFDGTSYYPTFDARHNFNVAWTTGLGRGYRLNLQWVLRTGFPYTGPVGQFQYVGEGGWWQGPDNGPQYYWLGLNGRRGNYRLPPYHRLDVGIEKDFKWLGTGWTWYLQVINVYAQKNVMWYFYDLNQQGQVVRTPFTFLPIPVPSFGIRGGF